MPVRFTIPWALVSCCVVVSRRLPSQRCNYHYMFFVIFSCSFLFTLYMQSNSFSIEWSSYIILCAFCVRQCSRITINNIYQYAVVEEFFIFIITVPLFKTVNILQGRKTHVGFPQTYRTSQHRDHALLSRSLSFEKP